jgi:hypothetical protein
MQIHAPHPPSWWRHGALYMHVALGGSTYSGGAVTT